MSLPSSIKNLSKAISEMPSMSEKGAERFLEFFWSHKRKTEISENWKDFFAYKPCNQCFFFAKNDLCDICSDPKKDKSKICVVSSPFLVPLIEEKTDYKGLYFVLGGDLVGSRNLNQIESVKQKALFLFDRIEKESINEVILANDFTSSGEATALFLKDNLKNFKIKITRLSRGFGRGDLISYSDPLTLKEAFENRR